MTGNLALGLALLPAAIYISARSFWAMWQRRNDLWTKGPK